MHYLDLTTQFSFHSSTDLWSLIKSEITGARDNHLEDDQSTLAVTALMLRIGNAG
jgi:hypothetical protein